MTAVAAASWTQVGNWLTTPGAIEAAIAAVSAGETIPIGDGTHVMTAAQTISANGVTLQFQSRNAELKFPASIGANEAFTITGDNFGADGGVLSGTDDVLTYGFRIQGTNAHIRNMEFYDFYHEGLGYSVGFISSAKQLTGTVENCWMERCRHAVTTGDSNSGNHVDGLVIRNITGVDLTDAFVDNHDTARNTLVERCVAIMGDADALTWTGTTPPVNGPPNGFNFGERDGFNFDHGNGVTLTDNTIDFGGFGRHGILIACDGQPMVFNLSGNEFVNMARWRTSPSTVGHRSIFIRAELNGGAPSVDGTIGAGNRNVYSPLGGHAIPSDRGCLMSISTRSRLFTTAGERLTTTQPELNAGTGVPFRNLLYTAPNGQQTTEPQSVGLLQERTFSA